MRIDRVTLRNFRGITASTVDFDDGVTVVEGPNEVGKSSIAEGLRLLRGSKSSSQARAVVDVQPVGQDVGPEVILDVRTGPYDLTYRKRWLKRSLTELTVRSPKPEQLTGDTAHERYLAILEETVDVDLLAALDVSQGKSLDQPDLATISALHRALDERDDSDTTSSSRNDVLMERVEEEFRRYFTKKGSPSGEYRKVAEEASRLREKRDELTERSREMDKLADEHKRYSGLFEQQDTRLKEAEQALESVEAEIQVVEVLREAEQSARRNLDDAETQHREVTAENHARLEQIEELQRRERDVTSRRSQSDNLMAEKENARELFQAVKKEVDAAESDWNACRQQAKEAHEVVERHRLVRQCSEFETRLERAQQADVSRRRAAATISNVLVDDAAVIELVDLNTKVEIARSARQAAAAEVTVLALSDVPVTIDGSSVETGEKCVTHALEAVTVEAEGIIRVEVLPGVPPAELEGAVERAETALNSALRKVEVASLDQARQVAVQRQNAHTELARATSVLEQILGDSSLLELQAETALVQAKVGALREVGAWAPLSDHPDDGPVSLADLEVGVRNLNSAEEEARAALQETQQRLELKQATAEKSRERWVIANQDVKNAEAEHERSITRLREVREVRSDTDLENAVGTIQASVEAAEERFMAAQRALTESHPEALEMRERNAHDLVVSTKADLANSRSQIDQLGALLDDRAAQGIYDQKTEVLAALSAAEEKESRLSRSAEAVKLLRAALVERREQAQRKYVAPFRDRIERLGRLIFGSDFTVEVTNDLTIESRTLNGQTVRFEFLSAGAREQIALLGRLASAQLIAEEEGAPVILDDTMGFADPERLAALNVVLNDVGRTAQIILLTCQPDRFASLGGARVVRLIR